MGAACGFGGSARRSDGDRAVCTTSVGGDTRRRVQNVSQAPAGIRRGGSTCADSARGAGLGGALTVRCRRWRRRRRDCRRVHGLVQHHLVGGDVDKEVTGRGPVLDRGGPRLADLQGVSREVRLGPLLAGGGLDDDEHRVLLEVGATLVVQRHRRLGGGDLDIDQRVLAGLVGDLPEHRRAGGHHHQRGERHQKHRPQGGALAPLVRTHVWLELGGDQPPQSDGRALQS